MMTVTKIADGMTRPIPSDVTPILESLADHAGALADAFYQRLMEVAPARPFLDHGVVEERLKPSMLLWVRQLLSDAADEVDGPFDATQRHIGEVHARIKIPMHLVMLAAGELQARMASLLNEADGNWQTRFAALDVVARRISRALELMSRSYVTGMESRARDDEGYRLFALDQDVQLDRESQRASLMEWAQTTLFQLLDPAGVNDLKLLGDTPFGLWVRHRATVMFDAAPELPLINLAIRRIDADMLPILLQAGHPDWPATLKALRKAVDELAFLLTEMFRGLVDLESGRDALTRALNRRFLPTILGRETAYAIRHDSDLAVLMLDIDHFKHINDGNGHQAGDAVLAQVAQLISAAIRPSDFLFRYGGEEFLIVLVESDGTTAQMMAERIRMTVADEAFRAGDQLLHITASIGIAVHDGHPDPDRLVQRADRAMYAAKTGGRNQTVIDAQE